MKLRYFCLTTSHYRLIFTDNPYPVLIPNTTTQFSLETPAIGMHLSVKSTCSPSLSLLAPFPAISTAHYWL